jgi:hypothetical protein
MVVSQTYSDCIERSGLIFPIPKVNVLGQFEGLFGHRREIGISLAMLSPNKTKDRPSYPSRRWYEHFSDSEVVR